MINIITPIYYGSPERKEYFTRYIECVEKSYNLNDVNFFFFVEPNSDELTHMIPSSWNSEFFYNSYRFKPALAHYVGFNYCFEELKLDHAFLLEDDIICSPDLFNLIEYWNNTEMSKDYVLCAFNKHCLMYPEHEIYKDPTFSGSIMKLFHQKYFSCWGTGFSREFWYNIMRKYWRMDVTFDTVIDTYYHDVKVLSPVISRTNQIGRVGLNYTPDLWDSHGFESNIISDKYVGGYNIIDANFN